MRHRCSIVSAVSSSRKISVLGPSAVLGARVDIDVGADALRLDPRDRHQHARALERRLVAEAGAQRPAAAEEVAIAQVGGHAAGGDPLVEQRLVLVRRFEAVQEQEAARLLERDHGVDGHQCPRSASPQVWARTSLRRIGRCRCHRAGAWWIRPARGWPAPPPESASPVRPARRACSRRRWCAPTARDSADPGARWRRCPPAPRPHSPSSRPRPTRPGTRGCDSDAPWRVAATVRLRPGRWSPPRARSPRWPPSLPRALPL